MREYIILKIVGIVVLVIMVIVLRWTVLDSADTQTEAETAETADVVETAGNVDSVEEPETAEDFVDTTNDMQDGSYEGVTYTRMGGKNLPEDYENNYWGPQDRQTFTWEEPAPYPCFCSITNNPELGNEEAFVRIKEYGVEGPHLNGVAVEPGKEYEVYIYYHNNASARTGDDGTAKNVRLKIAIPDSLKKDSQGRIFGIIESDNTIPQKVWDCSRMWPNSDVTLSFVENSAVLHSFGETHGSILDDSLLFSVGAPISFSKDKIGEIPSSEEGSRGYITFRVRAD